MVESTKLFVKSMKFRPLTAPELPYYPGFTHTDERDLSDSEKMICAYTADEGYRNAIGWPVTLLFMQAGFLFHHVFPYCGLFKGGYIPPDFWPDVSEWVKEYRADSCFNVIPEIKKRRDFERVDQFATDILFVGDRIQQVFFKHENDALEYKPRANFPAAFGFDVGKTRFHDEWKQELKRRAMVNKLLTTDFAEQIKGASHG